MMQIKLFLASTAFLFSLALGQVVYRSPRPYYSQAQQCSVQYATYLREFTALYRGGPCAAWYPFFDCCHLTRLFPITSSGVYEIGDPCVRTSLSPYSSRLHAKCDTFTAGGGWTIIMQRNATSGGSSMNFSSKGWNEYEDGFGSYSSDFWFGLSNIHCITQRETYELHVELTFTDGTEGQAGYSSFLIDYRSNRYTLKIGSVSGNNSANDGLGPLNGFAFQTFKYASNSNCQDQAEGGFWFPNRGACTSGTNLHAKVGKWMNKPLSSVTMMIRPVSCALIRDCPA